MESFVVRVSNALFKIRPLILIIFALITGFLLWQALNLHLDAGFEKNIPLNHPYMKTFVRHQADFGGANRVLVAVEDTRGDIFNPEFFHALRKVTDELFFIEGVDRPQVKSLFTANTRFIEVVEGGFSGGTVVPADFQPTEEGLEEVRKNTIKAGIVGQLVSNDFSSALVSAQLLEIDPSTNKRLDYIEFAQKLEKRIREKYEKGNIRIHIIGFAKMIGDIAEGAKDVIFFFGITIFITCVLVFIYARSFTLMILPIVCSLVAVIWQLGILTSMGFGLDPMSILVPFLVFAIGVSHGMQMINAMGNNVAQGMRPYEAAKLSFERLLVPGGVALLSDTVGFLTLLLIDIGMIQELAITASIGVAVIILTNLFLLPVLLSYVSFSEKFAQRLYKGVGYQDRFWGFLSGFARPKTGLVTIICALLLFVFGLMKAADMKIGDLHAGAPALHEDSRYNQDIFYITDKYSIGVDIISIIVEADGIPCTEYELIRKIDEFHWYMENVEGVHAVASLPRYTRIINAGYYEGNLKWRVIPRNTNVLAQATAQITTSSGLLNDDCTVLPVIVYTKDHKAGTIRKVVDAVEEYNDAHPYKRLDFRLACGIVGVMAATNEAVKSAQVPMLIWVYAAVILLCLVSFRSFLATICVIIPLILVSVLAQAMMVFLQIGLTVSTLPVVALGVGIGVDYGIYIINPMRNFMKNGMSLQRAYLNTLKTTGSAVIFTGLTLALGVSTWIFSALKFQMDIGILLSFMFMLNMIGAIVLLPAIAAQFWRTGEKGSGMQKENA